MKFALYVPTLDEFADPAVLVELARTSEDAGWDGIFLFDHLAWATDADQPARVIDTMTVLGAIAQATSRIAFGPMVTPVSRRRPQKLARETATLDLLSGGRLILGVGLGFPPDSEFTSFGEDANARVRATKLDEGLDLVSRLWTGDPVDYHGDYVQGTTQGFMPTPLQTPRVPIWTAAGAPDPASDQEWKLARRPLRRAARWDGTFPLHAQWPETALQPDHYRLLAEEIRGLRGDTDGFDLVHADGRSEAPDPAQVAAYDAAGVTWWFSGNPLASVDQTMRLAAGSPQGSPAG